MTSMIRKMTNTGFRDKFFIHTEPIPLADATTWFSIYEADPSTIMLLRSGTEPPTQSAEWFVHDPTRSYLLKDLGTTIYQKSVDNSILRIFRYIQWTCPESKQVHQGVICVTSMGSEKSPFIRHG
jgi:hypothetical protein